MGSETNRSTVDALSVAKRLQEYAERTGQQGMMILIDWEKAFDKISHKWLSKVLENFDLPKEILGVIKALYQKTRFQVDVDGVKSKTARQNTGIIQGCPLSPYLFIMVMDRNDIRNHPLHHEATQREYEGIKRDRWDSKIILRTIICRRHTAMRGQFQKIRPYCGQ